MLKGMTGFGTAEIVSGEIKGVIEIKSVNHRYVDIGYYLPSGFDSLEMKIKPLISKYVKRGRINVFLKITKKPARKISINRDAVKSYLKYAKTLKKEFGFKGELSLDQLVQLPGVIDSREGALEVKQLWGPIEKSLKKALKGLMVMRSREGKSLVDDIREQLKRMSLRTNKIQARTKSILKEKKKQMTLEEFTSFRKGSDVNEELKRLIHHISEIKLLLQSSLSVGKRIDFIAQEMQRETNTIGSKVQDKIVSNSVISLKSKIEKIREQAQNAE